MILFIAPNPHKQKYIEGYLQRVYAIDELFKEEKKVYSSDIKDTRTFLKIMVEADLIYVHSIYKSIEIINYYPFLKNKIITDLHGIVPEEELFSGKKGESEILNEIEDNVFKYGINFVAVTDAMVSFYKNKYKKYGHKKWITLPIFNSHVVDRKKIIKLKDAKTVIYAGGLQRWQNIDLMIDIIEKNINKKYILLTQQKSELAKKNINKKNILIKSVKPNEIIKYYANASYGFILRDDESINRVACPTKLIEYLAYGVVPIVKFEEIGDFKKLGYRYIKYDEFLNDKINSVNLINYAKINFKVLDKLKSIEKIGKNDLLNLNYKIKKDKDINNNKLIINLINHKKSEDIDEKKIEELRNKNRELEAYNKQLTSDLELIFKSKRWKLAGLLSSLKNILKRN